MSAQVILRKAVFTVPGADHLQVVGDLVQIQRSGPSGYEPTVQRTIERTVEPAAAGTLHWHPVGEPLG